MKYVDTSAVLRVLFLEPGPKVPLGADGRAVSSELLEVEAFRAVDRERLLGNLTDAQTAVKRKELVELLAYVAVYAVSTQIIRRNVLLPPALHSDRHQKLPDMTLYVLGRMHEQPEHGGWELATADGAGLSQGALVDTLKLGQSKVDLIMERGDEF